jgi:hypothetical protein
MASFPDSVKSFSTRSNGQVIDASHVNDLQDEVAAVETAGIGLLRGGALDMDMTSDPVLDTPLNNGDTYITYDAVNNRIEIAAVGDAGNTLRSLYKSLPSPIQITPDPTATIDMLLDFTIQSFSGSGQESVVEIGLMDGTAAINRELFGINLYFDHLGADEAYYAMISGSATGETIGLGSLATATRYQLRLSWQIDRPIAMVASLWNSATGASVSAESTSLVTSSTAKDAQLPHFGARFKSDSAGNSVTVYIHNAFVRVLRA